MRVLGACPRPALAAGAFLLWLALAGCWSARTVRPLEAGDSLVLAPDEGLIAVEIVSEIPIAALRFSGATAISDLPPGDHLIVLAVPEGSYRWNELHLPARGGKLARLLLRSHELLEFTVDRGRVNYLGKIQFYGTAREGYVISFAATWENRSAQVVGRLNRDHPGLLRRHPPVFGGFYRDDYLERYGRVVADRDAENADEGVR